MGSCVEVRGYKSWVFEERLCDQFKCEAACKDVKRDKEAARWSANVTIRTKNASDKGHRLKLVARMVDSYIRFDRRCEI
jgi:hypothetical protein